MTNGSGGLERKPGDPTQPRVPVVFEPRPSGPLPAQIPGRQDVAGMADAIQVLAPARELDVAHRFGAAIRPLPTAADVLVVVLLMDRGHHPAGIHDGGPEPPCLPNH